MSNPKPPTKPAGELLSIPAKGLLERMGATIDALQSEKREAEQTRERFESAIELMDQKLAYLDKLAAELLAAPEPLTEAYNPPEWEKSLLSEALRKANWDDLKSKGATDEQIATRLSKNWPDYLGYASTPGAFYAAPKAYGKAGYKPVPAKMTFFIATNGDSPKSIILYERTGAALFKEIRKLLGIAEPEKPASKAPSRPSAPAAKKRTPKPAARQPDKKNAAEPEKKDTAVAAALDANNVSLAGGVPMPAARIKKGKAKAKAPVLPNGDGDEDGDADEGQS